MGRPRTRTGIDLLEYRVKILPIQLERARKRVEHLEAEALRLGLKDLINDKTKSSSSKMAVS
jgi:hypothetical protein